MVTGDDIRNVFRRHMGEQGSEWLGAFEPLLRQLNVAKLPATHETSAIAFHNPKTAALCFDRIWSGVNPAIPPEVGFRGVSSAESILIFLTALLEALKRSPEESEAKLKFLVQTGMTLFQLMPDISVPNPQTIDQYSKLLADSIGAEYGLPIVSVYASHTQRDREYRLGDRAAIVAVLENVPVIDEAKLEWEQVLELRRDRSMLVKFRRFMHWLDKEMLTSPLSFIEDEVSVRLHEFHEVTHAHGLATTIGILQTTLGGITVIGGTAALAKLVVSVDTPSALASGAVATIAGAALHISRVLLNLRTQRANAAGELAYVIDLAKRVDAG